MGKKKGIVRRVYPGGNTYKGFYSYYDHILDQQNAKKIIVIKGGPGVGKSHFMKKLGQSMSEKGFGVEYHHCSSDNNSIDGVVFPAVGVALIDGTAPHVVDPKNPGGVDEIIHPLWVLIMNMYQEEVITIIADIWLNIRLKYFFVVRWDKTDGVNWFFL